jgi:hypothetical protein
LAWRPQQFLYCCSSALLVCGKTHCVQSWVESFSPRMLNFCTQHPLLAGTRRVHVQGSYLIAKGVVIQFWKLMFFVAKWVWVCGKTHSVKSDPELRFFRIEWSFFVRNIHLLGGTQRVNSQGC